MKLHAKLTLSFATLLVMILVLGGAACLLADKMGKNSHEAAFLERCLETSYVRVSTLCASSFLRKMRITTAP